MATLSEIIHPLSNFSVSPTLTIPDSRRTPSQLKVGICPSNITHTKEGPEAAGGRSPGLLAATGEGNSGESRSGWDSRPLPAPSKQIGLSQRRRFLKSNLTWLTLFRLSRAPVTLRKKQAYEIARAPLCPFPASAHVLSPMP